MTSFKVVKTTKGGDHFMVNGWRIYVMLPGTLDIDPEQAPGTPWTCTDVGPNVIGWVDLTVKDVVGTGRELPPDGYLATVQTYFVKEYRKKGYGTLLFNYASRFARSLGYKGIAAHPTYRSRDADGLWNKIGVGKVSGWDVKERLDQLEHLRRVCLEVLEEQGIGFKVKSYPGLHKIFVTKPGAKFDPPEPEFIGTVLKRAGKNVIGYMNLDAAGHELKVPEEFLAVASVFIVKEYRRQGIGQQLYSYAIRFAKSQGYRGLASERAARNQSADEFWKTIRVSSQGGWDLVY